MNKVNLEILKEKGFKNIGIDWIGKIHEYFFDIQDKQDSEDELFITINFAQNLQKNKLFEYLDELQQKQIISEYGLDKNKISILYKEQAEESVLTFLEELINKIIEIDGKCVCNNCNNTEDLAYYTNGTLFSLLCKDCGKTLISEYEEDKKKKNNYLRGFFGSLVGAIIGSVVWIIIGALGFFASIAGFAISYCAFKGYETVKGKLNVKGIIINVLTILLAFLFAQYAVLFIECMKEIDGMTLRGFIYFTPILFSDLEFLKSLLPDVGLGLLFAFLGTYNTIHNKYKSAKYMENLHIEKVDL